MRETVRYFKAGLLAPADDDDLDPIPEQLRCSGCGTVIRPEQSICSRCKRPTRR